MIFVSALLSAVLLSYMGRWNLSGGVVGRDSCHHWVCCCFCCCTRHCCCLHEQNAAAADGGRNSEIIALSGLWSVHNSWVPGSSWANYDRSLNPLAAHHYSNHPQRIHIIGIGCFISCAFHGNIQLSDIVWIRNWAPVLKSVLFCKSLTNSFKAVFRLTLATAMHLHLDNGLMIRYDESGAGWVG